MPIKTNLSNNKHSINSLIFNKIGFFHCNGLHC